MGDANKSSKVAILMGSDSDLPVMQGCIDQLRAFGIEPSVRVMSAHRTPHKAVEFASSAADNGYKVFICAAGMAAHLAGVIAAHTPLPVIGVPMQASTGPCGLDALLSTVQMPSGIPVATVAIGKAGAKNAAVLAVQMLALADADLAKKLNDFRDAQTQAVIEKDQAIQDKI